MKAIILPVIILLAFGGFASTIKKERDRPVLQQPGGEWEGQYCLDGGPFVNPLLFEFCPGGRLKVSDGPEAWGDKAAGTYYLSGDTLKARYRYSEGIQEPVLISAVVKGNTLEGTWQWVKGKGKLILTKSSGTLHL